MLFVNDGEGEFSIGNCLLENGVSTNKNVDRSIREPHHGRFAGASLVPPGQNCDIDRKACELGTQRLIMLAGKNFRWSKHCTLCPAFRRNQQCVERNQSLTGPNVALQQAHHGRLLRHIPFNFTDGPPLCTSQLIG